MVVFNQVVGCGACLINNLKGQLMTYATSGRSLRFFSSRFLQAGLRWEQPHRTSTERYVGWIGFLSENRRGWKIDD
jgi:hypothetical protein